MTRISLKEQYDNSSVIKQIADIGAEMEETNALATDASERADVATITAQKAQVVADSAVAKNTEQDATIATIQTKDSEQDALIAENKTDADTQIAAVKATADGSLKDVSISTDEVSATLLLKNNVEAESFKSIPLASENATGMMTKATYSGMVALGDRVTALEGKTMVVYVSFTSDEPAQSEITNLFSAQTGKAPIAGNQCVDIERSLTYQYNGSEWLKTTQQVAEWTNTTPGLVKGTPAGTDNAGTIFAESDGTGSVNGWDDLVARVANNETAIGTTIPAAYATKTEVDSIKVELSATTSTANDAQNKANGCVDNVALSEDGKTLIFTKIDDTHIDIVLPSRYNPIDFLVEMPSDYYDMIVETASTKKYKHALSTDTAACARVFDDYIFPIASLERTTSTTYNTTMHFTFVSAGMTYILNKFFEMCPNLSDGTYALLFILTDRDGTPLNVGNEAASVYNAGSFVRYINPEGVSVEGYGNAYSQMTIAEGEITKISLVTTEVQGWVESIDGLFFKLAFISKI